MNHPSTRIRRTVAVAVAGVAVGLATSVALAAGNGPDTRPASYQPAQRQAIAEWANQHQMSGLSPASLAGGVAAPVWTQEMAAQLAAIADYAASNGLVGLSPASLHRAGD